MSVPVAKLSFWGYEEPRQRGPDVALTAEHALPRVIAPDGTQIILDCWHGVADARIEAAANGTACREPHLCTHIMDHIQGIPFFAPLYAGKK